MKYSVLIITMLLIASVMTFRTRSRSRAHARLTDCAALDELTEQLEAADGVCYLQAQHSFSSGGFDAVRAAYASCVASELGFASSDELTQHADEVQSSCPSRR